MQNSNSRYMKVSIAYTCTSVWLKEDRNSLRNPATAYKIGKKRQGSFFVPLYAAAIDSSVCNFYGQFSSKCRLQTIIARSAYYFNVSSVRRSRSPQSPVFVSRFKA